jgi:hypothetical protein
VCCQYVVLPTAVPTELLPVAYTHDVRCQYLHSAASNREQHRYPSTRIKAQRGSTLTTLLILKVSNVQRSASHSSNFTTSERAPGTYWEGPRTGLDVWRREKKYLVLYKNRKPTPPFSSPKPCHNPTKLLLLSSSSNGRIVNWKGLERKRL